MSVATPFPLQWPNGRPRRAPAARKEGKFRSGSHMRVAALTVAVAIKRLQVELDRIGARLPVISSNMEVRLDGLPRSGARTPQDPGIAVYFQLGGKPVCLPCDTYSSVAQNIAAVAAHIEATRAIERHGVATVAEMFSGFVALPAPGAEAHWTIIFGVKPDASPSEIERAFRDKAKLHHPDNGGTHEMMARVNAARDSALKERS